MQEMIAEVWLEYSVLKLGERSEWRSARKMAIEESLGNVKPVHDIWLVLPIG